jgi:hypothetical protein
MLIRTEDPILGLCSSYLVIRGIVSENYIEFVRSFPALTELGTSYPLQHFYKGLYVMPQETVIN